MTTSSHIARTALALAIGVLVYASAADAAPHKPAHTKLAFGDQRSTLDVKFAEGSGVRLRGGHLVSATGDRIAALDRFKGLRVTRLFSSSTEDELAAAGREARRKSGREQDDLNLFFRINTRGAEDTAALADALNARDDVELAQPAAKPAPSPVTPSFVSRQGYRKPASSSGVDADFAQTVAGGKGENVTVVDVEWGWNRSHEDLSKLRAAGSSIPNGTPCDDTDTDHGTAVVGELAGDPNAVGVTGLVPGARIRTLNASRVAGGVCDYNAADAIQIAADNTQPGDVILLEQHIEGPRSYEGGGQYGYVPVEWKYATRQAIQSAVARGRIVIEPAGNGYQDLDDPIYNGWFATDSGAIMVGAGHSPGCTYYPNDPAIARGRLSYSDVGATVDLQGWGDCVITTGYGDLQPGGNTAYTAVFRGTSSASPIVAAGAAVVSSIAKARGVTLSAPQVRNLLRSTGQAQQFGNAGNIGPLPNLRAALAKLGPSLKESSHVVSGTALSGTTVPIKESWANSGSAATGYEVWLSTDGGAYSKLSTTASAAVVNLERGHSYQFAARAVDANGIWSAFAYGTAFSVGEYQEDYSADNPALTGTWTHAAWASASNGFLSISSTPGARASFTFTGTSVAWIASKATNRGQARVYIDGALASTVDLYRASTLAKSIAFSRSWTASGTHTITVEVVGTAGRPAVDVDSFVRLR